jgi:hypothetical protein
MGPRNVYNDMLNNIVSLIHHVVMNHQIILELMAYEAMFATPNHIHTPHFKGP